MDRVTRKNYFLVSDVARGNKLRFRRVDMRFAAKDGSMHPSQKAAFDAGQKPDAPQPDDQGLDQGQPPIQDNPEAMQAVDALKQMGYTADDVAQAMDADGGAPPDASASPAAPKLNIPGMA